MTASVALTGGAMKEIDVSTWERKSHYEWFSGFANPTFSMNVRLDLTAFLAFCKKQGLSSYAALMYAVCAALNGEKAFRYRVLGGKVYEIERANVAYTLSVRDEYFVNSHSKTDTDLASFCRGVRERADALRNSTYVQEEFNDTTVVDEIYCSCVPWIDFLSVVQPIPDNLPESSCIPRAAWGKYVKKGRRTYTTFNLTASHALVDGKDMSGALLRLQRMLDNPRKYFMGDKK